MGMGWECNREQIGDRVESKLGASYLHSTTSPRIQLTLEKLNSLSTISPTIGGFGQGFEIGFGIGIEFGFVFGKQQAHRFCKAPRSPVVVVLPPDEVFASPMQARHA